MQIKARIFGIALAVLTLFACFASVVAEPNATKTLNKYRLCVFVTSCANDTDYIAAVLGETELLLHEYGGNIDDVWVSNIAASDETTVISGDYSDVTAAVLTCAAQDNAEADIAQQMGQLITKTAAVCANENVTPVMMFACGRSVNSVSGMEQLPEDNDGTLAFIFPDGTEFNSESIENNWQGNFSTLFASEVLIGDEKICCDVSDDYGTFVGKDASGKLKLADSELVDRLLFVDEDSIVKVLDNSSRTVPYSEYDKVLCIRNIETLQKFKNCTDKLYAIEISVDYDRRAFCLVNTSNFSSSATVNAVFSCNRDRYLEDSYSETVSLNGINEYDYMCSKGDWTVTLTLEYCGLKSNRQFDKTVYVRNSAPIVTADGNSVNIGVFVKLPTKDAYTINSDNASVYTQYFNDADGDELIYVIGGQDADAVKLNAENNYTVGIKAKDKFATVSDELEVRVEGIELSEYVFTEYQPNVGVHKGDTITIIVATDSGKQPLNSDDVQAYLFDTGIKAKIGNEEKELVNDGNVWKCEFVMPADHLTTDELIVTIGDEQITQMDVTIVNQELCLNKNVHMDEQCTIWVWNFADVEFEISDFVDFEKYDILDVSIVSDTITSVYDKQDCPQDELETCHLQLDSVVPCKFELNSMNVEELLKWLKAFNVKDKLHFSVTDQEGSTLKFDISLTVKSYAQYIAAGVIALIVLLPFIIIFKKLIKRAVKRGCKGLSYVVVYKEGDRGMSGTANTERWHGFDVSLEQLIYVAGVYFEGDVLMSDFAKISIASSNKVKGKFVVHASKKLRDNYDIMLSDDKYCSEMTLHNGNQVITVKVKS